MTKFEEVENLWEEVGEESDVGQKRYLMYKVFDLLVEKVYENKDLEIPEPEEKIDRLQREEGYIYKLSQDFLTSSSTLEKEKKLEKIIEHIDGIER